MVSKKVYTMKMTGSFDNIHGAGWVYSLSEASWEPEEDIKIIGWTLNWAAEIPGFDAADWTIEAIWQLSQKPTWAHDGPVPGCMDEIRYDIRQLFAGTSAADELRNDVECIFENQKTLMLPDGAYINIREGEDVNLHIHCNNTHASVDSLMACTVILYYVK